MRSIFPSLCTGRWPNLAELVHCPFSIVTNSSVLSLGRSTSDPQKGLWLCLESSPADWGRASPHTEGPQQIKTPSPFPVLSGVVWVHMYTHIAPLSWVPPAKGRRPFPVTPASQTQQNDPRSPSAEGALDNGVVQELFNTHKFNST